MIFSKYAAQDGQITVERKEEICSGIRYRVFMIYLK